MGDIVNLNQFRKRQERADRQQRAATNRVRAGRTKAERISSRDETERKDSGLDSKRLDDETPPATAPDEPDRP